MSIRIFLRELGRRLTRVDVDVDGRVAAIDWHRRKIEHIIG
jgi:hypothetical protein